MVEIRVMGDPEEVTALLDLLGGIAYTTRNGRVYPARHQPGAVRVYLTVTLPDQNTRTEGRPAGKPDRPSRPTPTHQEGTSQ